MLSVFSLHAYSSMIHLKKHMIRNELNRLLIILLDMSESEDLQDEADRVRDNAERNNTEAANRERELREAADKARDAENQAEDARESY